MGTLTPSQDRAASSRFSVKLSPVPWTLLADKERANAALTRSTLTVRGSGLRLGPTPESEADADGSECRETG